MTINFRSKAYLATRAAIALAAALIAAILQAGPASAQLSVDANNSPFAVTSGNNSYSSIQIGRGTAGVVNLSGGLLEATGGFTDLTIGYSATGTLNLSGGTITGHNTTIGLISDGFVNQTGGQFTATNGINVGVSANGSYTISAGTVTGDFYLGQAGTATLTVTGTGFVQAGNVQIGAGGAGTGTVNLDGGTISAQRVTTNSGLSTMNFNGGTLLVGASTATYMQGLSVANVRNGGALIDTNGFNVTIAQALVHSTVGGDAAVDGGLAKSGAGTLTLSSANTYTGTTTIGDGTLALSGAGSIAASSGVINNSTFDISATTSGATIVSLSGGGSTELGAQNLTLSNASGTFSGGIGGTGGLILQAGTQTLSGINTYTGSTNVDGGILSVNGSIAASTLTTVNAGATLGGTGTVGNTVIASGGTLAAGNSIGTLSVNGNLTFNGGSSYNVELSPSASDRTNVSGTAALAGTVNATYGAGGYIAKQYTILNMAGGRTGTFSALNNNGVPANFTSSLSYDANNVYLNLALIFVPPVPPAFGGGLNANQQNAANALTHYFNTTGGIAAAYGTLSTNGLSQVSGEPGGGVQQAALTGAGMFMGSVIDNAFGAPDGAGQGGAPLGYAPQRKLSSAAQQAYAAVSPRETFEKRWSVWAAGYGGSTRVGGDNGVGSHDTTSRVYGTAVGATWRLSPDTQVGVAMGGSGSSFGIADGFGSGKSDSFNAAIYARHAFGPAYVAAALGYSWQDATTDRTVSGGGVTEILHASFRPQSLATRLEGGRRFNTTAFGVTPYAALQTVSLFMPSYSEAATSGTGIFALSYGSRRFTAARGELGARFDKSMMLGAQVLTLKGKAAWAHDWNNDRIATATFQQLPGATFTMSGATPAADAALLSFGADLALSRGWTIGAGFDGEFSRTTASYSGKGSLRYSW